VSDRLRQILAWWQIICGGLGLLMFGGLYFDLLPNGRAYLEQTVGWINYIAGIGFFSLVIAAGRALLNREAWGLWASFACQAAQVVSFAIRHGPQVQIAAGPLVGLKITDTQFQFSAGFNSSFFLGTLISGPAFMVTLNLVALVWAVHLFREAVRTEAAANPAAA
jgi:hypothetical protein